MTTTQPNRFPTGVLLLRDRIGDFTVRVTWPHEDARRGRGPTAGAVLYGEPGTAAAVARDAAACGVLVLEIEGGVERVEAVAETLGWLADHGESLGVDTGRVSLVAISTQVDPDVVAAGLVDADLRECIRA